MGAMGVIARGSRGLGFWGLEEVGGSRGLGFILP